VWNRISGVLVVLVLAAVVALAALTTIHVSQAEPPMRGAGYRPPAAEPPKPVSLWIGDSYTAGTGAVNGDQGEACLTAYRMGWICNLDAEGGTGFVNDGHINQKTYRPAIGRLGPDRREFLTPDVVVIDMGRNDGWNDAVDAAMRRYVARVREVWPDAELVMIVPYYMRSDQEPYGGAVAAAMRRLMAQYHGHVIDPFHSGWIGHMDDRYVWTDRVHPNPAGHEYIAEHLAADLRRLGVGKAVARS